MTTEAGRRLTVGAVVRALSQEFPDVTISKVRFLEAEGLVSPARTASGYRQFAPEDVERLRYVLRAQRDQFWPLRVIKDNLEAIDRGLTPGDAADGRPSAPPPVADPDVPDAASLGRPHATCGSPPPSWRGPPDWLPARSPTSPPTACCDPTRRGCTTRPTCRWPTRPPAWAPTASSRGTCAASARPRTARWVWSSRSSGRAVAGTHSGAPPRWPTCASPCTPRWCVVGCPAERAEPPTGGRGTVTQ